jgi:outer membrane protein assembly factor BamD
MIKFIAKIVVVLLCSIVVIGTASAQIDSQDVAQNAQKERNTLRERIEAGKKVGIHKIIKSGDPELIYNEALKYYNDEKWHKAADLFDASQAYYVGNVQEDSIAFFSARSKFKDRNYVDASVQLDEFRRKFGRSIFLEDSEAMLAMCQYYLAPDATRDQTITAEAIVSFSEFIERYPNSKRVEAFKELITELTDRLKKKAYLNAYTYYKVQRYKSAVVALRNALKTYPETPYREEMLYLITVSNFRLAHNSIEEKQGERYLNVLDSYYSFINEFPESKHRKELERYTREAKDYLDKNNIEKQ